MKKIHYYVAALCLLAAACKLKNVPDNFGAILKPDVTLPLVDVNLTLKDVVNSQDIEPTITENADGMYVLSYIDTVLVDSVSKYVKLNNQSFSQSFSAPNTEYAKFNTLPTASYVLPVPSAQTVNFSVNNGQRLTKVNLKSGIVDIKTTSKFPYETQCIVTFPKVKKSDGTALKISFPVAKNAVNQSNTVNLSGCNLDLTNGTNQNKLDYEISYSVNKKTGDATTPMTAANSTITFQIGLNNLNYSYIEGFLGEITLPVVNSSVVVELFKNSIDGDINFDDPKVKLSIDNSAGISADIKVDPLMVKFANKKTTNTITRNSSTSFLDTVISGANITNPNVPITSNIEWNAANSNIETVFQPSPFNVDYKATVVLNKATTIPTALTNFITDKSLIVVRAEVELPMSGTINRLTIVDTTELNLSGLDLPSEITFDSLMLKLNVNNGTGIDGKLQAYFLDSVYAVKDSLVKDTSLILIPAATVDAQGKVISSTRQYFKRAFTYKRYNDNLKYAKYIRFVARFNTAKNGGKTAQRIKLLSTNFINVKLAAEAKTRIKVTSSN
jgi:hypothetical protein